MGLHGEHRSYQGQSWLADLVWKWASSLQWLHFLNDLRDWFISRVWMREKEETCVGGDKRMEGYSGMRISIGDAAGTPGRTKWQCEHGDIAPVVVALYLRGIQGSSAHAFEARRADAVGSSGLHLRLFSALLHIPWPHLPLWLCMTEVTVSTSTLASFT